MFQNRCVRIAPFAALLLFVSVEARVHAAPVAFGTSSYEFISDSGVSWSDASTAASGLTYLGVSGHLATVTSAAENNFLTTLVSPAPAFAGGWLGGSTTQWLAGPEAGQNLTYTNWGGIEPNNGPDANVYMNIGAAFSGINFGQWADSLNGLSRPEDPIQGYFVEFEAVATPLPAALPLFATGLAGLGWLTRRRRKQAE